VTTWIFNPHSYRDAIPENLDELMHFFNDAPVRISASLDLLRLVVIFVL